MGGETPDAIDQSWDTADAATAARLGIEYVSMYLSWDPTKNITATKVKRYHKSGIAVGMNWESQAGAPLNGGDQGAADATEAVRQARALIKAVGYAPEAPVAIVFSCDRDVNAGQYPRIDAYYRTASRIVRAAGFLMGVYAEADLVDHLSKAGLTDVEWQASAWSGGRVSREADLYQYLNGQRLGGASVDFDRIIHAGHLGAWWPPGRVPTDAGKDVPMSISDADAKKIAQAVLNEPISLNGTTKPLSVWVAHGNRYALDARTALIAKGGVVERIAALQAAVSKLTVGGVDLASLAEAVGEKVKAFTWRAS